MIFPLYTYKSNELTHSVTKPTIVLTGNTQSNQRQWGQGSDSRGKQESSWSSRQQTDSRSSLSHGQTDRWSGSNMALQQDTHQPAFATQIPGGIITAGVPGNMVLTSAQMPAGIVMANTALAARGQPEPRFDAYKSMQTQFRRY